MQHYWKRVLPNIFKSALVGTLFMLAAWVVIVLRVKQAAAEPPAGWQWQFLFIALGFLLTSMAIGIGITRPQPPSRKWSTLIVALSTLVSAGLSPLIVLPLAAPVRSFGLNVAGIVSIALACGLLLLFTHFPLPWRRHDEA